MVEELCFKQLKFFLAVMTEGVRPSSQRSKTHCCRPHHDGFMTKILEAIFQNQCHHDGRWRLHEECTQKLFFKSNPSWWLHDGTLPRATKSFFSILCHYSFMTELHSEPKVFSDQLRHDGFMTEPGNRSKALQGSFHHKGFMMETPKTKKIDVFIPNPLDMKSYNQHSFVTQIRPIFKI